MAKSKYQTRPPRLMAKPMAGRSNPNVQCQKLPFGFWILTFI